MTDLTNQERCTASELNALQFQDPPIVQGSSFGLESAVSILLASFFL